MEASAKPAEQPLPEPNVEVEVAATQPPEATESEQRSEAQDDDDEVDSMPVLEDQQPGQSKKKRQSARQPQDHGLSGKYWQTPPAAGSTGEAVSSSRPRRSNAGSLMKTALQEIDSKKKRTPPASTSSAAPSATPPSPATSKPPAKYFRVSVNTKKEEEPQPAASVTPTSRRSIKRKDELPPQPVRTSLRARGQPRKDTSEEEITVKEEKKELPPPVIRTYGRRRSTAIKQEVEKEEPPKLQPVIRTYPRRSRVTPNQQQQKEKTPEGLAKVTPPRVSPSQALKAALSIPDKILPTSHEKFLDRFRESQEKSPTPPDRRVQNLDELVATYKSKDGEELAIPEDQISESESDTSESSTTTDDQKENVPSSSASSIVSKTEATLKLRPWEDEDKQIPVVKLGNNQLLINNEIVDIDYTNYIKESDVEVPFDYDVLFQPEPPLEVALPVDTDEVLPSQPSSPPPAPLTGEEVSSQPQEPQPCKLEACKTGCVCCCLKEPPPLRDHCGKAKCFLECSCLFKDQLHVNADDKNIRARLRPRVTLLNWKHISRNGNCEQQSEPGTNETVKKKSKKKKIAKKRRAAAATATEVPLGEPSPKRLRIRVPTPIKPPVVSIKGKFAAQLQKPLPASKPGPLSSKPRNIALLQKAMPRQVPAPIIRKPTLISARYPSNHPLLRRLYSCQPCHVKLTKMPPKWSHWKKVESHCATDQTDKKSQAVGGNFVVTTSNFKVAAQEDLSYTIVRPGGSILAMLYWESHTKVAPKSFQPSPDTSRCEEPNIPWLYLPLPSAGKVWLFFEIPKYPEDVPSVWLPELGVFLPTDKLSLMTFEASQTRKTCKVYFELEDEEKLTDQGLLNYVYLVPHLPSLLIYGPAPKACLKSLCTETAGAVVRKFSNTTKVEVEAKEELKKQLDAAGTDLVEIDEEDPVEYEDDIDRSDELIDPQIFEQIYKNFMIQVGGDSGESEEGSSDQDYDEVWEEFEEETETTPVNGAFSTRHNVQPKGLAV